LRRRPFPGSLPGKTGGRHGGRPQADLGLVFLRLGQPALQHPAPDLHLRPLFRGNRPRLLHGRGLDEEAAKAAAQAYWGWGLAIASLSIAILAPILGAIADGTGRRLIWVWTFSAFYVVGSFGLWWVAPGGTEGMLFWAVCLFGIGFIGMEFATIFTNALMPSLTQADDLGAISGTGFAFGYLGGLLALVIMLLFFAEGRDSGLTLLGTRRCSGWTPRRARAPASSDPSPRSGSWSS
jgi:MFS-type transporter involved in bile tolerance (Atg22 family)